jgi:hypothetical protein
MRASAEGMPRVHWFAGGGKAFSEADQMSHIYSMRRSTQRGICGAPACGVAEAHGGDLRYALSF